MAMKNDSSCSPSSKTCTTFEWLSCAANRASVKNT